MASMQSWNFLTDIRSSLFKIQPNFLHFKNPATQGGLGSYLSHTRNRFPRFNQKSLSAIWSNTWWAKHKQILTNYDEQWQCLFLSSTCNHRVPASPPAHLCPASPHWLTIWSWLNNARALVFTPAWTHCLTLSQPRHQRASPSPWSTHTARTRQGRGESQSE